MHKITVIFGQNIKRLRAQHGLTQNELATRIGVSLTFLQNIEAGRRWVGTDTISSLAQGLEVSECDLFVNSHRTANDSHSTRASRVPPPGAAKAPEPLPDPKQVLLLICQALGYELPAPMLRKLKASRPPAHHLAQLPQDIYSDLISLCQGPECEWDLLRKTLRSLSASA